MKKWLIVGTLVIFLILLINSTYASAPAPAPKQFVINPIEEKCGIYWAGDEFTYNELKEGWIIQRNISTSFELKTPYGKCTLENIDKNIRASTCCNKLGLNYVDFRNISYSLNDVYENGSCGYVYSRISSGDDCEKQGAMYRCLNPDCGKLQGPYKCKPSAPVEGSIIIDGATNKCTDLFTFYLYPSGGYAYGDQCFITEGDFATFKGEYKTKLITPYGECENFSLYNEEVYHDCCDKLGFTFVGTDLDSNYNNCDIEIKIIGDNFERHDIYYYFIVLSVNNESECDIINKGLYKFPQSGNRNLTIDERINLTWIFMPIRGPPGMSPEPVVGWATRGINQTKFNKEKDVLILNRAYTSTRCYKNSDCSPYGEPSKADCGGCEGGVCSEYVPLNCYLYKNRVKCANNTCISLGFIEPDTPIDISLWQKIINWFKSLFS